MLYDTNKSTIDHKQEIHCVSFPITMMPAMNNLPATVAALLSLKGQIVTLTTAREMKHKKGFLPVLKVSTFQCRMGCAYDNLSAVKEGRGNGTLPEENQGLNGVAWVVYPHLLVGIKSGKYQMRCTRLAGGNAPTVTFLRDGGEITREVALEGAYSSEFPKDESPEVFNVSVGNITHVNSKPVDGVVAAVA